MVLGVRTFDVPPVVRHSEPVVMVTRSFSGSRSVIALTCFATSVAVIASSSSVGTLFPKLSHWLILVDQTVAGVLVVPAKNRRFEKNSTSTGYPEYGPHAPSAQMYVALTELWAYSCTTIGAPFAGATLNVIVWATLSIDQPCCAVIGYASRGQRYSHHYPRFPPAPGRPDSGCNSDRIEPSRR